MHKKIVLIALVFILAVLNWSIYKKEQHIKHGDVVFLKLAPVDPRSLMQGDYMALRFDVANKIYSLLPKREKHYRWRHNALAEDGEVVLKLNAKNVGSLSRLYNGETLKNGELKLNYRVRNGAVKFATNAFFFEEGSAKKFEKAQYGEFRVSPHGELLLVAMADENATVID